jgi:urease accessory protein
MIRANQYLPAGKWDLSRETDAIELPHDGRHRRRTAMRARNDTVFLLDLAEAAQLKDGDGLVFEDGRVVRVIAAKEPLLEITGDPHLLQRVAWHLGNRHVPAQLLSNAVRIAPDHVLEKMLIDLGARVAHIEAAFDPEAGAYAQGRSHDHHSDHHHHADGHGH